MVFHHIFRAILNNSEPFALNLNTTPWRVSVRAQVILGFVALGLGKGGLFVSTYLIAIAWLEPEGTLYAVVCSLVTLIVMALGYIITFARIEAEIDPNKGVVRLVRRMPFHRHADSEPLAHYRGIALVSREGSDKRLTHTLMLEHPKADLSVPLWQRRWPEPPDEEAAAYAKAFGMPRL